VFRVTADASRIVAEGDDPDDWNPRELTVLSRPLTFAVVGQDNQSWRKSSGQWQMLLPGVSTLAYAG
jgi:hypothetical protein